jgi:(p)ppGpp synthase/HD superfamily hydrolase
MVLTERFQRAFLHAANAHACQLRKGTAIPYISHLMAVASLVLENGGDEDEAIAALLHDAVEDQGGAQRLALIRAEFGEDVAEIVDGCTDADTTPKPPWKARKLAYLQRLPGENPSVLLVSAADKLHNIRCILEDYRVMGEGLWPRFNAPSKEEVIWYYRALIDTYRDNGTNAIVDEIERAVETLEGEIARATGGSPS